MGAGTASLGCRFDLSVKDARDEWREGFLAALCMLDFELSGLL